MSGGILADQGPEDPKRDKSTKVDPQATELARNPVEVSRHDEGAIDLEQEEFRTQRGSSAEEEFVPKLVRESVGVPVQDTFENLPSVVREHIERRPFEAPEKVRDSILWFEGSFNPFTDAHLDLLQLGQGHLKFDRVILGITPQNPLKPKVTPLNHRVEMVKKVLQWEKLVVAERPGERGIYVTESPRDWHSERIKSWFSAKRFLLMGPDNFEKYMTRELPWGLGTLRFFKDGQPLHDYLTCFPRIYKHLFANRLMVVDRHYAMHATHVRAGEQPIHPAISEYIKEHNLYPKDAPSQGEA